MRAAPLSSTQVNSCNSSEINSVKAGWIPIWTRSLSEQLFLAVSVLTSLACPEKNADYFIILSRDKRGFCGVLFNVKILGLI